MRRQNFSVLLVVLRENEPASIASIAILRAASAEAASVPVMNRSSRTRLLACSGLPFGRCTQARHLPGFFSNALMMKRLYSIRPPDENRIGRGGGWDTAVSENLRRRGRFRAPKWHEKGELFM